MPGTAPSQFPFAPKELPASGASAPPPLPQKEPELDVDLLASIGPPPSSSAPSHLASVAERAVAEADAMPEQSAGEKPRKKKHREPEPVPGYASGDDWMKIYETGAQQRPSSASVPTSASSPYGSSDPYGHLGPGATPYRSPGTAEYVDPLDQLQAPARGNFLRTVGICAATGFVSCILLAGFVVLGKSMLSPGLPRLLGIGVLSWLSVPALVLCIGWVVGRHGDGDSGTDKVCGLIGFVFYFFLSYLNTVVTIPDAVSVTSGLEFSEVQEKATEVVHGGRMSEEAAIAWEATTSEMEKRRFMVEWGWTEATSALDVSTEEVQAFNAEVGAYYSNVVNEAGPGYILHQALKSVTDWPFVSPDLVAMMMLKSVWTYVKFILIYLWIVAAIGHFDRRGMA